MHEDVHEELIHSQGQSPLGLQGHQDEVRSHQGHQDEGGTHGLHVGIGLGPVGHSQLSDQNAHYVQQEEEVHLRGNSARFVYRSLPKQLTRILRWNQ